MKRSVVGSLDKPRDSALLWSVTNPHWNARARSRAAGDIMAEKTQAPKTDKTPSGSVAEPAAPTTAQARRRSGLTGHLPPTFWRMRPSTVVIGDSTLSAAPAIPAKAAPAVPTGSAFQRWWQGQHQRNQGVDRAAILIILCALLSLGIYLYGVIRFPLGPNLSHGYEDIGQLTSLAGGAYQPEVGLFFLLAIASLFGAWGLVYWLIGRVEHQAKTGWWRAPILLCVPLFGFPILALLVMLFMYPITAVDVFDYASQIRVFTVYHLNPLTIAPGNFPNDPFLRFNPWNTVPASYGPLWVILSALVSLPAGNHFLEAVLAQKLLSVVACLGCMIMLWLLARRLCPERRWQVFVFFAWNPLILYEVGVNGHNDAIMAFFMLAGIAALLSTRWYWQALALPLLAASVLVKWTTLLLLPLAVLYLLGSGRVRRWGLLPLLLGTALTALYAIPLIMPFVDLNHPLGVLLQSNLFTTSPPALLHTLLAPIYGTDDGHGNDPSGAIARIVGIGAFALVYLDILIGFVRLGPRERVDPAARLTISQRFISACLESYFWYFVLATFWFQPWYLLALLPLAALHPRPLTRTRGALFALGAALSYVIFIFLWKIYWWSLPVFTVAFVACVAVYGLPLFTRVLESWQKRLQLYALLDSLPIPATLPEAAPRRRKTWWIV